MSEGEKKMKLKEGERELSGKEGTPQKNGVGERVPTKG